VGTEKRERQKANKAMHQQQLFVSEHWSSEASSPWSAWFGSLAPWRATTATYRHR